MTTKIHTLLPLALLLGVAVMSVAKANANTNVSFDEIEAKHWQVINDGVMGGKSDSRFYFDNDYAVFEGNVSLANNGGFASVRRIISPQISSGGVIQLLVKGDGNRYQLRLKTADLPYGAAYVANFDTTAGQWKHIEIVENDFKPKFRGRHISAPALDFGQANQIGFLIAEKQAGAFKLQLKDIVFLHAI